MKKILILTHDKCDDSELVYPLFRFIEQNFEVKICSIEKRELHAKNGYVVNVDYLPEEVNVDDYAGLYLPGGHAPEKLRQNPVVLELIRKFHFSSKPICAVCHGPQLLISSNLTKDLKCTCYPGIKDDLVNSGAIFTDESCVVDKNIVTARKPSDMPQMIIEFFKLF